MLGCVCSGTLIVPGASASTSPKVLTLWHHRSECDIVITLCFGASVYVFEFESVCARANTSRACAIARARDDLDIANELGTLNRKTLIV